MPYILQLRQNCGPSLPAEDFHYHSGYQLLYVQAGEASLTIGGKTQAIRAGEMAVINQLELHRVDSQKPYTRTHLLLSPQECMSGIGEKQLFYAFSARPPGFSHVIALEEFQGQAEAILSALADEQQAERPFAQDWALCSVRQLLILVYRLCLRRGDFDSLNPAAFGSVWQAKEYLEQHFTQELSIAQVARDCYMTNSSLDHAFKRFTGFSPKRYLLLCRLAAARELLCAGSTVTEAAQRSGFSDLNNFIRYFRQETGLTPGQFRRRFFACEQGLPLSDPLSPRKE